MSSSKQDQLLDIYKLHSDLADRVSQRRDDVNRLFVTIATSLAILTGLILRFGAGEHTTLISIAIPAIAILLCIDWMRTIYSYRQLNASKFEVLHELERKLPFQFFIDEWDPQKAGRKSNDYLRLSVVAYGLPGIFMLVSLVALTLALINACT